MYLFARNRSASPDKIFEAVTYAVEIAATVSSITGKEVSVWQGEYGVPLSSISWTTTAESHAEMGANREKLLADPGYLDTLQAGSRLFEGDAQDGLVDIVATAGSGGHKGDFASMVTAECAPGKIGEAMTWGVEIMTHVAEVTGRDGLFGRTMYGPWGQVGWISLASSLDEVDAAGAALSNDPDYVTKLDGSGGLFRPGSGATWLARRIG